MVLPSSVPGRSAWCCSSTGVYVQANGSLGMSWVNKGGCVGALTVFEVRGCCKVLSQFELMQLPVSVSASGVMRRAATGW